MTAQMDETRHPVVTAVLGLRAELSALSSSPVWGLSTTDTEAALLEVTALATQAAQLQMRLLAHADRVDVGQSVGATSAANWFAHTTRTTRPAAHRAARLAGRLDAAHPAVDAALADATINVEQAQVIVDAVDNLPTDLIDAATIDQAEAFLLKEAADHDARALRILGRRLLEVVDSDAADAEEARRLEAEEAEARAAASFTMSADGHGKCHGRFTLPLTPRLDAPQGPQRPRRHQASPRPTGRDPDQAQARTSVHGVHRDPRRGRPPERLRLLRD